MALDKPYIARTKIATFPNNSLGWYHHVAIPDDIAHQAYENNARRISIKIDSNPPFPAAILKSETYYYILISKAVLKKLKLSKGQLVEIQLEQDHNPYGMPLPPEFKEVFAIDDEAFQYFDAMKPGVRRALMHIIIKIKSDNLRAERTILMLDFIKLNRGEFEFKAFNEYVKTSG
jgi:hypothetical protein